MIAWDARVCLAIVWHWLKFNLLFPAVVSLLTRVSNVIPKGVGGLPADGHCVLYIIASPDIRDAWNIVFSDVLTVVSAGIGVVATSEGPDVRLWIIVAVGDPAVDPWL
tara:strand:+ start:516 stop:839 length:324 start_codon:yes stop_codon:yes gene_type:complete